MKFIRSLFATAAIAAALGLGFLYSGIYDMGADVPHNRLTYWMLETLRERSIAKAASGIRTPNLEDPKMLIAGGQDYNDMCSGCHLKPGKTESDFTTGLYPQPPNLSLMMDHHEADGESAAAQDFWVIKHGIKASGMAAFGKTHDDERIWAMVAFIRKLPTLTPEQYQIITARSGPESGREMAH